MDLHRLLLPFAIVQGLWVLRRTPSLPAPPGAAGRFGARSDEPIRVVGVGDSIMAGTGVREQCCSLTATFARLLHEQTGRNVEWQAHGRNGATSAAVLHDLAPIARRAHVYVISCGVNDATRGVDTHQFASNLGALLTLLRRKSPQAAIVYGGLPPLDRFPALPWPLNAILAARVAEMQAAAAEVVARDERARCFAFPASVPAEEFASDGFHPGEYACERWARGLIELWRDGSALVPADVHVAQAAPVRRRAAARPAAAGRGSPWPRASRS
jgi:lysophospholipase L1-like esterase